ncbi:hypothetical protein AXE80_08690 [Wenyingzhuangia fucanilytica]|uniref:Glycosyl transferase family 1 domain-containing protein n=1 Tax=Wenyingzhuangia fucanilytica TaxID=1790137 RepID=A0A1B1Y6H9_9FLAO|nr:hypothetical protein AXE80_08690 [Wenyingzhuangia fucanilytica]
MYAGLEILKQDANYTVEYIYNYHTLPSNLTKIIYNDLTLIFDIDDSQNIVFEYYDQCDFYVKRMLTKEDYKKHPKTIPYGLNYSLIHPNCFLKKIYLKELKFSDLYKRFKYATIFIKYSLKYHYFLSKTLNINDSIANNNIKNMTSSPSDSNKIIFRARLWNPLNKEDRNIINQERIDLNRKLKEKHNSNFIGGIQTDSLSIKICPDLIIPKKTSDKKAYLKDLKKASIGIANVGLDGSIGWKFSEYITHSLAIVTNPISQFQIHGNLQANINYLEYSNNDECINQVQYLIDNPEKRKEMQYNNFKYYNDFLKPEKKLKLIFDEINLKSNLD